MRSPRFSVRFLLLLVTFCCIAIRWYTWPSLLERLCQEVPTAKGERLRVLFEQVVKLNEDERIEFQDFITNRLYDDQAARKRFEATGYQWAKSSPEQAKAWMIEVCRAPNGDMFYNFFDHPFPDPIVLGFARAFCENDFDEAFQLMKDDHFDWFHRSKSHPIPVIVAAMERKSFDELVAWLNAQQRSIFLFEVIEASEHLLAEKDFEKYVALMPEQFGDWDKRWVDVMTTVPLLKADYKRCRQLLEESYPDPDVDTTWYWRLEERLWSLAVIWVADDPRGYALWGSKQPASRRAISPMVQAWPDDDLEFLEHWMWDHFSFVRHDGLSIVGLLERLPNERAIPFIDKLFTRMEELDAHTVCDVLDYLHDCDPTLSTKKLQWALKKAREAGDDADNRMLSYLLDWERNNLGQVFPQPAF